MPIMRSHVQPLAGLLQIFNHFLFYLNSCGTDDGVREIGAGRHRGSPNGWAQQKKGGPKAAL
jgi:hypothetical protein